MIVLGSTGSIGVNTLIVAKKFGIEIEALVAGKNILLLNEQIKEFNPKFVVVADEFDVAKVNHKNVKFGQNGILEMLQEAKSELVVNALVGISGLSPTQTALNIGKTVALANKETLVTAGAFLDKSKLRPIDSEHFALWYLLQDKPIESMIITASGGAFRDLALEEFKNVTVKEALMHPNWSMGAKITVDSATMTNKVFEILEAYWFFGVEKLDAIVETKSLMHAIVNFKDGSSTAHFANADMKLPISYALGCEISGPILSSVDFLAAKNLEFREIKTDRYPIWELKNELLKNPKMGAVLNAANEVAVEKFLKSQISFDDIAKIGLDACAKFDAKNINSIEDVFELDRIVRGQYV